MPHTSGRLRTLAGVLLFTGLGAAAPTALAGETAGLFQWRPFLGPFHSVLLHFPIGFVVMAFVVDLYSLWRRKPEIQPVIKLMLGLSVVTTLLTIGLGLMRATGAEYDPQTLVSHKNHGIAVGVLALVTLLAQWLAHRDPAGAPRPLLRGGYRLLLVGTIALLVIAGHEGGNLTHGSNYLTKHAPEFVKALIEEPSASTSPTASTTGDSEAARLYLEKVKPVFDTKCLGCHGPEKQKGKYRMDQPAVALKGGDSEKLAIKPGDPFASNLVRLILLPPDHDDVMPPTGKGTLTPDEVMHVIRWIQQGAVIPGHTPEATAKP